MKRRLSKELTMVSELTSDVSSTVRLAIKHCTATLLPTLSLMDTNTVLFYSDIRK